MLGFLPVLAFVFLWLAIVGARESLRRFVGPVGPIFGFTIAAVVMGLWAALGTELLSLGGLLRFWPLVGFWGGTAVACGSAAWRTHAGLQGAFVQPAGSGASRIVFGLTAFLFFLVFLGAVLSAPSNYDSMAYHLARQIFWMQQGSVDFYPTNSIRQLFMPPFSEYLQLHHMILAGSDRFANLVQTFALLGSMLGAIHLARVFGAGALGQAFAAFLVVSNPMAFMEGSSTKNDVVVCFFVVATALLAVRVVEMRRASWSLLALIGGALGLLLLTKGTAIVFALPVCALAGLFILRYGVGRLDGEEPTGGLGETLRRPMHWLRVVSAAAVIAVCALAPNVGHFARNNAMFGHFTGPVDPAVEGSALYVNEHMLSWQTITSNAIRSATLHLALPWDSWNDKVLTASLDLHARLGLDPYQENTTWKGMPYKVVYFPTSEDRGGTSVHFLLALIVPLIAPFARDRRDDRRRRWLVFAWSFVPWLGFLAFCAVFRWQPWHSRLHIPIFVLLAPLAGWLVDRPWLDQDVVLPSWRRMARYTTVAVLVMVSLVWIWPTFAHVGRPLWGKRAIWATPRDDQRFNWRTKWERGNDLVVELIRSINPPTVGFRFGHNDIQYPMPRMILDTNPDVKFVNVNPKPATNPDGLAPTPEILVVTGPYELERAENGRRYLAIAHDDPYVLYAREDLWAAAPRALEMHRFLGWSQMRGLKKPRQGERLGRLDVATLVTDQPRRAKSALVMDGSNAKGPVDVKVRGKVVGTVKLGAGPVSVVVSLQRGKNQIELVGVKDAVFTVIRLEPTL